MALGAAEDSSSIKISSLPPRNYELAALLSSCLQVKACSMRKPGGGW